MITMATVPTGYGYGMLPSLTPVFTQVRSSVGTSFGLLAYLLAGAVSGILTNKATTYVRQRIGNLSNLQLVALQAALVTFCLALVQGFATSHLPAGQQATGTLLFISMFLLLQTNLQATIARLQN